MVQTEHPFAGRRTRVLGMEDVRRLLDIGEAIEVQRQAFLAQASGQTVVARNSWLRLPERQRRGWLKLLAGWDGTTGALGVKILARFPDNPSGANLGSVVILFDDANGFPLAVMDGAYLTAARTGGGAALATEAFAPSTMRFIGLVGTGVVAWYSILAISKVRPVFELRVYSRNERRREAFVDLATRELGIEAVAVTSVEDAVTGADVVVTATNSPKPVLREDHLVSGQLVNAMGIRTEIAAEAIRRCLVIPDGRQEAMNEGKFSVALASGLVTEDQLGPELGRVLAGAEAAKPGDTIMFDSSGVALQDVAAARFVWERAEKEDVGIVVDLGLAGSP